MLNFSYAKTRDYKRKAGGLNIISHQLVGKDCDLIQRCAVREVRRVVYIADHETAKAAARIKKIPTFPPELANLTIEIVGLKQGVKVLEESTQAFCDNLATVHENIIVILGPGYGYQHAELLFGETPDSIEAVYLTSPEQPVHESSHPLQQKVKQLQIALHEPSQPHDLDWLVAPPILERLKVVMAGSTYNLIVTSADYPFDMLEDDHHLQHFSFLKRGERPPDKELYRKLADIRFPSGYTTMTLAVGADSSDPKSDMFMGIAAHDNNQLRAVRFKLVDQGYGRTTYYYPHEQRNSDNKHTWEWQYPTTHRHAERNAPHSFPPYLIIYDQKPILADQEHYTKIMAERFNLDPNNASQYPHVVFWSEQEEDLEDPVQKAKALARWLGSMSRADERKGVLFVSQAGLCARTPASLILPSLFGYYIAPLFKEFDLNADPPPAPAVPLKNKC